MRSTSLDFCVFFVVRSWAVARGLFACGLVRFAVRGLFACAVLRGPGLSLRAAYLPVRSVRFAFACAVLGASQRAQLICLRGLCAR